MSGLVFLVPAASTRQTSLLVMLLRSAAMLRFTRSSALPRSLSLAQAPATSRLPTATQRREISSRRDSDEGSRAAGRRARRPFSNAHVVQALQIFYEREQHFAVPFRFVVPQSADNRAVEWPLELHGLPLGGRVHRLVRSLLKGDTLATSPQTAKVVAQLVDMGFPLLDWADYWFEHVYLRAIETYKQREGDLFVPQKFVVPESDPEWPRATWGLALGLHVAKLRKQRRESLPTDQAEQLDELGFVWSVRDAKWTEYFMPGLRRFYAIHGHVDVPLAFSVPDPSDDARWPSRLAGYMLGRHVYMVRSGKYAAQAEGSKDELDQLGFSMNLSDKAWSNSILPALRVFTSEFHHCDVQQDFVVPATEPWPKKSWGFKLGQTVKSVRRGAYETQVQASKAELEQLGFVWNARHRLEKTVRTVVLPALSTYERIYGDLLVSTDFVVPEGDPEWPALTWGFRLGHWITRVRAGQIELPQHIRAEVDGIGFIWRFNDARWNDVLLPSFRVYKQLHGSCARMSTKFRVPHEEPYPRQAWGVNLGGAVWHIRNGDTYVSSTDKQSVLKELGVL